MPVALVLALLGITSIGLVYFAYTSFVFRREIKEISLEAKRLSAELDTYAVLLKDWDIQKTEFISIASHQLRTPLTVIQGYVELLQRNAYGPLNDTLKEIISEIEESCDKLSASVESLLNVAQIEQGSIEFRYKHENFNAILRRVFEELAPVAEVNATPLLLELPENELIIFSDAEKIRHVIFNFIENAIKYGRGGDILVNVSVEGGSLRFEVRDNGCGFEPEEALLLFEKFYRTGSARENQKVGTGLGLYIAKSFIEGHKGRIWAKSEGKGKGSLFGFSLPLNSGDLNTFYTQTRLENN